RAATGVRAMKDSAMTAHFVKQVLSPRLLSAPLALLLSVASVACGGAGAETPAQAQAAEQPGGQPAATAGGQQFAVSDAPTSRETGPAAQRPNMNATALTSYQAGMQAFQAGDLQGAKNQFVAATQADPKAYQAYYSLGV